MCNDADMLEMYEEHIRVARKDYRCCECGYKIRPADKYHYAKGMLEHRWEVYKTCLYCNAIWNDLRYDIMDDGCRLFNGLYECFNEADIDDKFMLLNSISADSMKQEYYDQKKSDF